MSTKQPDARKVLSMSFSKDEIEQELLTCNSVRELSERLNLTYNATRMLLKEYGIPSFPRGQRKRHENNREFRLSKKMITHYYCELGLSLRQIAGIAGVSFQAVHGWLLAYNIPLRKRGISKREQSSTATASTLTHTHEA